MSQFVSSSRSVQAFPITKLWAHPFDPERVVIEAVGSPPVLLEITAELTCNDMHPPMPGCWLVFDDMMGVDIMTPEQFEHLYDADEGFEPEQMDMFEEEKVH